MPQKSLEQYLLGRLTIRPGASVPLLDELPLRLVLELVAGLADLVHHGYSTFPVGFDDDFQRAAAADAAFKAVVGDGLTAIFSRVVLEHRNSTGVLSPKVPVRTLGSFAKSVAQLLPYPAVIEKIRQSLEGALGYPVPDLYECDYVHIDTVSHESGAPAASIVQALVIAGELHRCHPQQDDLYLPLDVAWRFVERRHNTSLGRS